MTEGIPDVCTAVDDRFAGRLPAVAGAWAAAQGTPAGGTDLRAAGLPWPGRRSRAAVRAHRTRAAFGCLAARNRRKAVARRPGQACAGDGRRAVRDAAGSG